MVADDKQFTMGEVYVAPGTDELKLRKLTTARFRLYSAIGGKPEKKNLKKLSVWHDVTYNFIPPERFVDIDDWDEYIEYLKDIYENSNDSNYMKAYDLAKSYIPRHGLKEEEKK